MWHRSIQILVNILLVWPKAAKDVDPQPWVLSGTVPPHSALNKAHSYPCFPPSFFLRCTDIFLPESAPFPSLLFFTCQSPVLTHMLFSLRMSSHTHMLQAGPVCWIKHPHICLPSTHSSRRGVTTLICHAPCLPFITDTLIQHTSDVISLQLEIHQARGVFNCLVGAVLPKPSPFSPSHLFWVSPHSEALFCQGAAHNSTLTAPCWRFSI